MPVKRYKNLEEAEADLPASPDPETGIRTAIALSRMDEATRRGIRISQRGVHRYREIWEGEADRERYALEQLRGAHSR
jgi:hypothetical protein